MRKLLASLLAVALLLSLMPMGVVAYDGEEEVSLPVTKLYVGTVNALENPQGEGWSFDAATNTLTLNNCTLTESMVHVQEYVYEDYTEYDLTDAMIYVEGDLTIELIGTNSVERVIEEEPTDYTQYYAILAAIYQTDVNGETWDYPGKLSFTGSGSLTAGIAITADAWDAENWSLVGGWDEYLEFSAAIGCWANGSADLTGLCDGGWMEIYGGILGAESPWNVKACANSPTIGEHCFVTAYQDVEGTIENEYGYNWNNNDAWRMKVVTFDAILQDNGMLLLGSDGSASGQGWSWENKVLTLYADTEVKAVSFKGILGDAKLVLAGDVALDATGMGYDSNYNNYGAINASCDLEINTGSYTLTVTADSEAIRVDRADLLISGGTVVSAMPEYSMSIYSQGGNVSIRNATFRTVCTEEGEDMVSGEITLTTGYDPSYNEVPVGDLLIENAVIDTVGPIYTNDGNIAVKNSTLTMAAGYSGISCSSADIRFQDSDITISCYGTAVDASYGVIEFDNCNLELIGGEDEPLLIAARYYSYYLDDPEAGDRNWGEPYLGAIRFLNMDITAPAYVYVDYVEEQGYGYTCGYVTVKDSSDGFITRLQSAGTKVDPTISQVGANLSYEDLIYVIDIFEIKDAEGIDLSADAGMLIFSAEEYAALNGNAVFDAEHAVVGLKPYKDTGYYYAMSDGIYTRDLHVENYYIGYLKLADGSYVFSEAKLYNPAIYADNMLDKEDTDSETRELCVALLNFNAAAQQFFHPGTDKDDLVNNGLNEDERELDWSNVALNLAPVVPEERMVERDPSVFTATGKNLLFEEMISLGAIYKIDDSIVENALECGTIFWTAEQFNALNGVPGVDNIGSGIKTGLTQYRGRSGQWVSNAPEIAAKDMADTEYYILGYVVHADGSVSYSGVMTYTIEQYISNMADDADMGELVMRLYYYERAAKAALG